METPGTPPPGDGPQSPQSPVPAPGGAEPPAVAPQAAPDPPAQEPPGGWQQPMPPSPKDNPYAVKYPGGRVWLFSIFSFGLYTFYWFYRNRRLLDGEYGDRDDAVLHTCGLLVPILGYFITYWLWRDLNELRLRQGLPEFSVVGYLVGTILGLGPIFYSLALGQTNEYWDARTAGHAVDAPVTTEEKVIVGIGAAFFALFMLFFIVAILIAVLAGN